MKRILLFLFLLTTDITSKADELPYAEIPPCGIACVYAVLAEFDRDVSLNDVSDRYAMLFPEGNPKQMPLAQVQSLIQSFNLHTLAIQGNLASLEPSLLPAILCITHSVEGKLLPIGHAVLLREIRSNHATIIDYQADAESISFPIAQLQILSDGRLILISQKPISLPFPWTFVVYLLTIFTSVAGLCCILHSCFRKKYDNLSSVFHSSQTLVALLLLISLPLVGCRKDSSLSIVSSSDEVSVDSNKASASSKSIVQAEQSIQYKHIKPNDPTKPSSDPVLLFEKSQQNYGKVQCGNDTPKTEPDGSKVEFIFPFTVGKEEVQIEKIETSCGCVISDSPLIGKILPASSEQSLKFVMDLYDRCGEFTAHANIITNPKSLEPIMLRMDVFVKQVPEVVPSKLLCRGVVGKKANVELNINYRRDKSVDKMELDMEKSDFGIFHVVRFQLNSEAVIAQQKEWRDHARICLETKDPVTLEQAKQKLNICFKGDFSPIDVPVKFQVEPKIQLAVNRLFIGEIGKGEEKNIRVRVVVNDSISPPSVRIMSADEGVSARFDEKEKRVSIKVTAPQVQGRFEKHLRISLGTDDSEIDFPISGIMVVK